ncbi:MAG TPA: DUF4926 domain-containing protein [Chloroflexota bacterium]|jgi:hypothetical protein|nr:DUF4926 domain-containing protein [Chloroflexota bacterium]
MTERIAEHDVVVLTQDVPDDKLQAGDVAVVLAVHSPRGAVPAGYTLEITTITGETAAVVDVPASHVRPADDSDIRHSRQVTKIA